MATQQEVVLRPGDSISVRLEVPGQPLRLDLSLTPEGMTMSQPMPMGAPTIFGGVRPPEVEEMQDDSDALDLTAEFAAEDDVVDEPPPAQKIESLAAVEPFGDVPQAVDIPFEDVSDDSSSMEYGQAATEEVTDSDDLDLDLNDLGGEEEVTVGVDVPADDFSVDVPADDFSVDIPADDLALDIPSDDAVDIPADDEPGFSADAMTMVPTTRQASQEAISLSLEDDASAMELDNLSLDGEEMELDADGNPKKKFKPGPEDTLPVWTGKASTYVDPELQKKKETSKLNKAGKPAPAAKLAPAAKPAAKALSTAKPVTKQIKKPVTGGVGPAAASGKKPAAPAAAGGGNFTVFLSPPKGADKKQAAAEIIAEIQGIDLNSALALAGKMIVPVVKGVSENEAGVIRDRFKDAGLSCRITQKR